MTAMIDDIQLLLARDLESFAVEIDLFPDEESVWKRPPGIANAAGNLVLHVCGNLRHFIGHVLGGSGYVRDRAAEFAARSGSRQQLKHEIQETIPVVTSVLPRLSTETLAGMYPEKVGGRVLHCGRFLIHLCTHTAFHLGQAGYFRRILTENSQSSDAVSLKPLGVRPGES
jgi:hypothetical protein